MMGGQRARRVIAALLRLRRANGDFVAMRAYGYTIVEVMIVIAVTGALFVSAAVLISGRQQQTQFGQAIREVRSQIQQVITEVNNGFYPSRNNFSCTVTGAGAPQFAVANNAQGTNEGCVFLGKAIQFQVQGTDPEQFRVLSIAGRQRSAAGDEVASLAQAQPRAIAPDGGAIQVDASVTQALQYGLSTAWADAGVVAFVSSLNDITSPTGASIQQLDVIPVNNTLLGMALEGAAQTTNANIVASPKNPEDGVRVCFASGGTDQSGLITIGGPAGSLSVNLDIKSSRDCS